MDKPARSRLPDELLARIAAAGRPDEFEEIVARYRTRVYRICYRMAGNVEDAEDWAQECLVRVYRQLPHYKPSLPFAPWLLRVVSNTCLNLMRGRARTTGKRENGLGEEAAGSSREFDPEQILLSTTRAREILGALESLNPTLKQAVVLRVVEDLSLREVAEVLGVPLQTAASRVRRALESVRMRLRQNGCDDRDECEVGR